MAPAGAFQLRACGGPALTALPMSAILKLSGVSKRFGSLVANDNLSMHLNDGEALGVIGPNGSGKTTMFNILTGITKADQGQVFFQGTEIAQGELRVEIAGSPP